jgi:hypothetical protein
VRQNELKEIPENITTSKVKQYPLKKKKNGTKILHGDAFMTKILGVIYWRSAGREVFSNDLYCWRTAGRWPAAGHQFLVSSHERNAMNVLKILGKFRNKTSKFISHFFKNVQATILKAIINLAIASH